jgi:putative tricarboxylic transport membrane protein
MKNADQWSGLVLLIISGLICWGSILLPYGNILNPGPGFYPLWLGILLGAMSVALFLKSMRRRGRQRSLKDILAEKVRWDKVLFILIALALYGYLMNIIGFLIVTILLMAFLLRFIEPHPWRSVIVWTLIGSFGSYLIFEIWMKLRLPKGFWGV